MNIFNDYQWFIDNDFPIALPSFFKKIYKKLGDKNFNKKKIKKIFKKELNKIYGEDKYAETANLLKSNWVKIEDKFFQILADFKIRPKSNFICYLSLYGPSGQFKFPNIVNLRVANKKDLREANTTIAHEIIHLSLYKKVNKINLSYEQTEGLVDLFFTETDLREVFPNYPKQNITIHDKKLFRALIKS